MNDQGQKILVIDDEDEIRTMLHEVLQMQGFNTSSASDGTRGLEKFKEENGFDLVLTDLMMPGIDGIEVLEEIKKIESTTEVILLTGHGSHDTAIDAMKKGAYDYLEKPMDLMELILVVRKALERRRLSAENKLYQEKLERLVEKRTAELTGTQNFLKTVLNASTDYSIIATNCDGIITLFNRGSESLIGYSAKDVEGKESVLLFTPENQQGKGTIRQLKSRRKDELTYEREKIIRRKDGELIVVSLSVTSLTDSKNNVIGTLGIAKDITEEKKLEEELRKYTEKLEDLVGERTRQLEKRNQELEETLEKLHATQAQLVQSEKMASLGQLAAGVAHEINNPMGFIQANIGALRKYTDKLVTVLKFAREECMNGDPVIKEKLEEKWKANRVDRILGDLGDLLSESDDGVTRVKTIVKDLKNFSHLGNAEYASSNLVDGMESTLNIVRNEIKYKAEVERIYEEVPPVMCNVQQINQVFLNILVNAAQAIDKKPGLIRVHVHPEGDDRVSVDISDNGNGIEPSSLDRIFDPFYTTKAIGDGTGLGLSVSYRIIKDHGGTILVDSEVGKGTTFRIILPVKGPQTA